MHKNKHLVVLAALLTATLGLSLGHQRRAQAEKAPASVDTVELHQALLDLTSPWTVMCVAAHPDDEDGTSLIVLRHKYGVHTVSLFSTFGEGGQNAIGPELYEEMGAMRARETMAAAEIQGSEPHFLGLKDFGFSKTAAEAFKFWGHDEALRRMVLQIRTLRPDVIITNHDTMNGHGHHQATGRLLLESFEAAADATRFPEQLRDGVGAWQVQRIFLRVGFGNRAPAQNANTVTIDPNETDPVRGTIYAEEALRALQKHATQGPWPKTFADMLRFRNSQDGKLPLIRYVLVREAKSAGAHDAAGGASSSDAPIHSFLDGLRLPDEIAKIVEPPTIDAHALTDSADKPGLVLEQLLKTRQKYTASMGGARDPRLVLMTRKVERAIALAAGVTVAAPSSVVATPNSTVELQLKISNSGSQSVGVLQCGSCAAGSPCDEKPQVSSKSNQAENLAAGSSLNRSSKLQISPQSPINVPLARHLYEPKALGLEMITNCSILVANARVNVRETTRVDVASPVEIESIAPAPYLFTPANLNRPLAFKLRLVNNLGKQFKGEFRVSSPTEHINETGPDIALGPNEGREFALNTNVIPVDTPAEQRTPRADFGRVVFSVLPPRGTEEVTAAETRVAYADAHVAPNLRVGYVRGFDFSLPNALLALGVDSKELSVDEVKSDDLQKYSTIIVDNRVYESQPALIAANQKLLDYANAGGTLIVFYHKSNEWNPDERRKRPQLAPYKLTLGEERITDENALITLLEPQHPLLNAPNKLGPEDFLGWIQERGLYYPRDWDPQYHALLQANDPGEAPLKGGLLVADYGRGHYIYTSMVWYRQLRAGVPGGYRMLANMISYGHVR